MNRFLRLLPASLLAALAVVLPAYAQELFPTLTCTGLVGCGQPPQNVIVTGVLPVAAKVLLQLVSGGAVIAIIVAGTRMAIGGSEETGTTARKGALYALGGLGLALAAGPIISFITTEQYVDGTGGDLLLGVMGTVVRIIMTLFNVGLVIVIIIGGSRMAMSSGSSDEFQKGGLAIKWAVIGAVVVNLARAIVQAALNLSI